MTIRKAKTIKQRAAASIPPAPGPDSREALAVHIAAIMAHPLTPARLFNEVGDFINDEWSEVMPQLERDPAFILRILDLGTCGYLLCPGGGCKGECRRMSNKELKRKRGEV
jgi:hypothetical protein